jgi:predicted cobalt transporter CbtA
MLNMIEKMSDKEWRARIGSRIEALTAEAFQVIRWAIIVGFARYLSDTFPSLVLDLLYWGLASLLFAYLVSRFLLRPEVPIMPNPRQRWQRILQTMVNLVICILAFALALWAIGQLTETISQYRASV